MNILVCGSRIEKIYVKNVFDDTIKSSYKNQGNYEEYTYSYGWKFQFFEEGIETWNLNIIFKKIEKDYQINNDIIIYFIGDSLENAKKVINYFSEKIIIYHTFIIFISTNKNITKKVLHDYIQEEEKEFDSRNLEVLIYSRNEFIIPLLNILILKACYFNEVGNLIGMPDIKEGTFRKKVKGRHSFNILVIEKPGTGKSTFINIMNGDK